MLAHLMILSFVDLHTTLLSCLAAPLLTLLLSPLPADVTIGAWMLAFNTTPFDDRRLCETSCTATSIAVYDMPKCAGEGVVVGVGWGARG